MAGGDTISFAAERVAEIACRKCNLVFDVGDREAFEEVLCPKCDTSQVVPLKLGNFLLTQFLGQGGMGAVYVGHDQSLGRDVAIKLLSSVVMGDSNESVSNFMREARAAAQINSPNVVQIFSVGEERNQPFIVMELIDGGKLDEIIETQHTMDEMQAVEICRDAAKGLKAAQDINLFHGDIKPENILIDTKGVAKLADFGLAQFLQKGKSKQIDEIWGTPYYIAPEKARRQQEDFRSDIYSLGATLYHCLTGVPPFDGETAADVVIARLKGPAPDVRTSRGDIHPETAEMIARMLETDPNLRQPNYAALISDMTIAEKAIAHGPVDLEYGKRSNTPLMILGGVILLIIGIVGFFLMDNKSDAPEEKETALTQQVPDGMKVVKPKNDPKVTKPKDKPTTVKVDKSKLPNMDPFDATEAKALKDGTYLNLTKRAKEGEKKLKPIFDKYPKFDNPQRPWIYLLDAMSTPDKQKAHNMLEAVANLPTVRDEKGVPNPAMMPIRVARFLQRRPNNGGADLFKFAERYPDWFTAVCNIAAAIETDRRELPIQADKPCKDYLAQLSKIPLWLRGFEPMMKAKIARNKDWSTRRANSLKKAQDTRALEGERKYYIDYASKAGPEMQAEIARLMTAFDKIQQKNLNSRRKRMILINNNMNKRLKEAGATLKSSGDITVAESNTINSATAAIKNSFAQHNFPAAKRMAKKAQEQVASAAGKTEAAKLTEKVNMADAMNTHVLLNLSDTRLSAKTIKAMGGQPANASESMVSLQLPNGTIEVPWRQITPAAYINMAYEVIKSNPNKKEAARLMLGLAVFSDSFGRPLKSKTAKAAEIAVTWDPTLKDTAEDFMK